MGDEARVHLHHPSVKPLLVLGERLPLLNPVGPRCEAGVRREDPHLLLPPEDRVAGPIPTHVELAAVLFDPLGRRVVWSVTGTGTEVEKEGLAGLYVTEIREELDCLAREVFRKVVALFRRARRVDIVVVRDKLGVVLVCVTAKEAIEALEAAAEGPAVSRGCHVHLDLGSKVPLAHGIGCIALRYEDL